MNEHTNQSKHPGRPRKETIAVQIRLNKCDKEIAQEIATEEGRELSELIRVWIGDRARAERLRIENHKALVAMEAFLNITIDSAIKQGYEPDQVAQVFGVDYEGLVQEVREEKLAKLKPLTKETKKGPRSSNTGLSVPLLAPEKKKRGGR